MASAETVAHALKGLKAHYRTPAMSEDEEVRWRQDYATELVAYGDRAVNEAARRWKLTDSRRMPTVGEFVSLARAQQAYGLVPDKSLTAAREWELGCVSDGDYADMTLREKAREQRLRGRHYGIEAARRIDRSRPESEQGETYLFNRNRERECLQEAQRLEALAKAP